MLEAKRVNKRNRKSMERLHFQIHGVVISSDTIP